MQIERVGLPGSVTRLKLTGKLDINGSAIVEIPIALAAKDSKAVIIDMSGVTFVASLGVRHLVMAAKSLGSRGGKLVLYALSEPVAETLGIMGIGDIIPMVGAEHDALGLVAGPAS